MKNGKFNSYEEFEMQEMERFIKKKREMDHMSKYYEYGEFEGYDKGKYHDYCGCHGKDDWGKDDGWDKGDYHDKDKDVEVYCCVCKKKKKEDKKKHPVCKHEHKHKHYHKHEYEKDKYDHHGKHDHCGCKKKKCKDKADMLDFVYDTKKPENVFTTNGKVLVPNFDNVVSTVTLNEVCEGNLIMLNGLVGLDSDDFGVATEVEVKIEKGDGMTGATIYQSVIDLGEFNGFGDKRVEPALHVDKVLAFEKNVNYKLIVRPITGSTPFPGTIKLGGPVTFTAMQIGKKHDY